MAVLADHGVEGYAVHAAEVVQRDGKLEHQRVDRDEVANGPRGAENRI